jgi:NADPH-dependent ferric siderophore reductase
VSVAEAIVPTVLITAACVHTVERLSPTFVRVTFAAEAFIELPTQISFDTRFKVIFPGATGAFPEIPQAPEHWYANWQIMPDDQRPQMRTYTIREIVTDGDDVRLVADFVVHADDVEHPAGPGCRWALAAKPGDRVQVIAPHRRTEYGGSEFDPGEHHTLLVIGDETAVPAIGRILADLGPGYTGQVFIEVPTADDFLDLKPPEGLSVHWLARGEERYGRRLVTEVRRHLALPALDTDEQVPDLTSAQEIDLWETPRYSSSGENVEKHLEGQPIGHDLYAWIAGESWTVKALRRALVKELEIERGQVAFMGYWREDVSMKS